MKRYLFILAALPLLTWSCEEQLTISQRNRQEIMEYLDENNLDAIEDQTGLFYIIEEEGSGDSPVGNANVEVRYKGYFIDGTIFDQTPGENTREFNLQQVITGWRIGIPKMKKGGKAMLIVPSNLGYGFYGSNGVPPNAVLIFEIELVNFVN
ncbi:MAG TPA: FKBP-type peptidyl-prolyl cis-trans isomerase [Saprospiraceae bacterium]|nr:FKBP-type peptidyl-prolyl cis-trans isomerase [Saprospiraceae bacterium]